MSTSISNTNKDFFFFINCWFLRPTETDFLKSSTFPSSQKYNAYKNEKNKNEKKGKKRRFQISAG